MNVAAKWGQILRMGPHFHMEEEKMMTKQKDNMDKGCDLDNSFVHLLNTAIYPLLKYLLIFLPILASHHSALQKRQF